MGIALENVVAAAGSDAAYACMDAASVMRLFVDLPTSNLTACLADGSLLEGLRALTKALPLDDADTQDLACAYAELEAAPRSSLEELRQDFTRLYTHPKSPLIEPYEAAFRSGATGDQRPLLAVNRTARELDGAYARCGFRTSKTATVSADHIAVELEFFESALERLAGEPGTVPNDRAQLELELSAFAANHARAWWGTFFAQTARCAKTPEYVFAGTLGKVLFTW